MKRTTRTKGVLTIETEITEYHKIARIAVKGYWPNDTVRVWMDKDIRNVKWLKSEVNYGGGGSDGTLSNRERILNFIKGLKEGLRIAQKWNKKEVPE
jgi:hypothetical protein